MDELVLASASKRRRVLLEQLGLKFKVFPSQVEEDLTSYTSPRSCVLEMASSKVQDVAERISEEALIIGADTVIYFEDRIIGKPAGREEAAELLYSLSDSCHQVWTGMVVLNTARDQSRQYLQRTDVFFRRLKESEIDHYLESDEPWDKAGAYAIQGMGAAFVKRIEGCFYTVVGLPLGGLMPLLYSLGWKGY